MQCSNQNHLILDPTSRGVMILRFGLKLNGERTRSSFELNFLNHALKLHENTAKSIKFPYHKLAYACYRVGDEARAVLEMQKWLAKNPMTRHLRSQLLTWGEQQIRNSNTTIKTGLVFLDPEQSSPSKDTSSVVPKLCVLHETRHRLVFITAQ